MVEIPWLSNTAGVHCFSCKDSIENVIHFFFDFLELQDSFESVWAELNRKILSSNYIDGTQIPNFINSLDIQQKALLLLRGFCLSSDQATAPLTTRSLSTAVSKIYH